MVAPLEYLNAGLWGLGIGLTLVKQLVKPVNAQDLTRLLSRARASPEILGKASEKS